MVIIAFQILTTGRYKLGNPVSLLLSWCYLPKLERMGLLCFILCPTNKSSASVAYVTEYWFPRHMGKHQTFLVLLSGCNYLLDRYSTHYRWEIPLSDSHFLWGAVHNPTWYMGLTDCREIQKKKKQNGKKLWKGKAYFSQQTWKTYRHYRILLKLRMDTPHQLLIEDINLSICLILET